jgi:solute carrier family 25 protein 38
VLRGHTEQAPGALGAVFATFLTAPFDTIKTKRQLRPLEYTSIARSVALIASRKGMVGFFEGAALRMARKAGSSAIAWSLYEGLVRRYQR